MNRNNVLLDRVDVALASSRFSYAAIRFSKNEIFPPTFLLLVLRRHDRIKEPF